MDSKELKEVLDEKIGLVAKNLDDKIANVEENLNLKLQGVNAEVKSGNDMLLIKINEVLCLKGEVESVKEGTRWAVWVKNHPKTTVLVSVLIIIIISSLSNAGYAIEIIKLLK
jgi:hypothetical protein